MYRGFVQVKVSQSHIVDMISKTPTTSYITVSNISFGSFCFGDFQEQGRERLKKKSKTDEKDNFE